MAAVVLHAAVLITILLPQRHTLSPSATNTLPVSLVFAAPSPPAERVDVAAPMTSSVDIPLAFDEAERANEAADIGMTTVGSGRIPSNSRARPRISAIDQTALLPGKSVRKKRQVPPTKVAIYDVLVDAAGNVHDVVLTRSSGVRSFDEAGKKMIYDGIALPQPSREIGAVRVTLRFSPETP